MVFKNKKPFKDLYKYEDDKYIRQISLMYNYPIFARIYRVLYVIKVKLFNERIGVKNLIKKIIKTYMPFIYKPIHDKRMKKAMNEEGALTYNYDVNEEDYKAIMNQMYSNFEKPENKETFVAYNNKPYEGTEEDNIKLNKWKEKNTKFYNNAINIWTIRDVNKRNMAKQNKLNYIEFWDLNELKNWLNT